MAPRTPTKSSSSSADDTPLRRHDNGLSPFGKRPFVCAGRAHGHDQFIAAP
ncbi:hypothetical protein ACFOLD_16930 [Kocuria carniphila]|uniref:hypothetical protein n=1 Tax=Kocuria carniphila TaxID=262208 RepID=UPI003609B2D7